MSRLLNTLFGWEEIMVTQDLNQYMKVKADCDSKGIRTRSEFVPSRHRGFGTPGNSVGMYYLYTKKIKKGE